MRLNANPNSNFHHLRWLTIIFTIFINFSLIFCQDHYLNLTWSNIPYQELTTPIIKSPSDPRLYSILKLDNDLEVLLVSDPQTESSAVSIDINVGYFSDPNDLVGLAHFCEHLLFMGTEKYPEENAYEKYLSENSGSSNAMTMNEDTIYHFHVSSDALEGALDRFSQFFISPTFNSNSIDNAVAAIDSEYKKNLHSYFAMNQVQKNVSNPHHPYSQFPIGNDETLSKIPKERGIDIRERLIEFHRKYYTADKMKLVVIGRESLEGLKSLVIPKFSNVPNHKTDVTKVTTKPFNNNHLGIKINVASKLAKDQMTIEFLLPTQVTYIEEKPSMYIINLIESTERGSISEKLNELGLAYRVTGSLSEQTSEFSLFQFDIQLTSRGLVNQETILEIVFEYIDLIKRDGIRKTYFDEIRATNDRKFRFQEKIGIVSYARILSTLMQFPIPLSQVLGSDTRISKFNSTLILQTLDHFIPTNMRVMVISEKFDNHEKLQQEYWFGLKFFTENYSDEFLKKLSEMKPKFNLRLPELNPIVVSDFSMIESPLKSQYPVLLSNSTTATLWYLNGNITIPKATVNLILKNNHLLESSKDHAILLMMIHMFKEQNTIYLKHVQKAGFKVDLSVSNPGLVITINGFSDKIDQIILTIVQFFKNLNLTESQFEKSKNQVILNLKNQAWYYPVMSTRTLFDITIAENQFLFIEKYQSAEELNLEDIIEYRDSNLSSGSLELLIIGNLDISKSKELFSKINQSLNLAPVSLQQRQYPRWVNLTSPSSWVYRVPSFNPDDINSAIGYYLDTENINHKSTRAIIYLILKLIQEPIYNQLRTKENLGYMVDSMERRSSYRGGIWIEIQSERDPIYLESRIDAFLTNFYNDLMNLPESEIQQLANLERSQILNRQTTLYTLTNLNWNEITYGYYDFDQEYELATHLATVKKSQLLTIYRDYVLPTGTKRKKVSIHVMAPTTSTSIENDGDYSLIDCGTRINEIEVWQRNLTFSSNLDPIRHEIYLDRR